MAGEEVQKSKKGHIVGNVLKTINFFRQLTLSKNYFLHKNLVFKKIRAIFFNEKLDLRLNERMTAAVERKTFITRVSSPDRASATTALLIIMLYDP